MHRPLEKMLWVYGGKYLGKKKKKNIAEFSVKFAYMGTEAPVYTNVLRENIKNSV